MPSERTTLTLQGGYYVTTGVAPYVSRRAFAALTGPKREWWLVQTVGAIVTTVGATLLAGARSGRVTPDLRLLAAGLRSEPGGNRHRPVARRRIAPSYLFDAAPQIAISTPLLRSQARFGAAA